MLRILAFASLVATVAGMQLVLTRRNKATDKQYLSAALKTSDEINSAELAISALQTSASESVESDFYLSEAGYQAIAALHSDDAMAAFSRVLLAKEGKMVANEGELSGFVPWFSGTSAVQTVELLKTELMAKSWVVDAEDCHDMGGEYEDEKSGNAIVVHQTGCSVNVEMMWDESRGRVIQQGKVDTDKVTINEFKESGEFTEEGDIVFPDGGYWQKKTELALTRHYRRNESNVTIENDTSTESVLNVTSDAAVSDESVLGKSVNASSGDQAVGGDGNQVYPIDANCADVGGEYKDQKGNDVSVYQAGCYVKVKLVWNESVGIVLLPGTVERDGLHVDYFAAVGDTESEGKITFSDGGVWTQSSSTPAALPHGQIPFPDAMDSNTTSNESMTTNTTNVTSSVAVNVSQCEDVSGRYKNASWNETGDLISVQQTGFNLTVVAKVNGEDVFLTGTIDGYLMSVAGFSDQGTLYESSLKFKNGPEWAKLNDTEFDQYTQDGCSDVGGYYSMPTGQLVSIEQVGCQAFVTIVDDKKEGSTTSAGILHDQDVQVSGFKTNAHLQIDGTLAFSDGVQWGKLEADAVQNAFQDTCQDASGNYRDSNGDIATVTQEGCSIKVQMQSETEQITVGGYVFDDVVNVKKLPSMGKVGESGNLQFFNGKEWTKLSDQESADLGIPEGGCTHYQGTYKDEDGQPVLIMQTGCKCEVTFWLANVQSNVTRSGYVSKSTLHIQDFKMNGVSADGGIQFGNKAIWAVVSSDEPILSSAVVDASVVAAAPVAPASNVAPAGNGTSTDLGEDNSGIPCANYGGAYVDVHGKVVEIKQVDCTLEITHWDESLAANVTSHGRVDDQTVSLEDFSEVGVPTGEGLKFGNLEWWQTEGGKGNAAGHGNVTTAGNDKTKDMGEDIFGIPCANYGGSYVDEKSKVVEIKQVDCTLEITHWSESLAANVTTHGTVVNGKLKVDDFAEIGNPTDAGLKFGELEWFQTSDGTVVPTVDSAEPEIHSDAPAVGDSFGATSGEEPVVNLGTNGDLVPSIVAMGTNSHEAAQQPE